jgi:hypothetical protein
MNPRRPHQISIEALFRHQNPAPAANAQPWLDEDNDYVDFPLPDRNPPRLRSTGGRLGMLRAEHAYLLARYDSGAMPLAIYAVVRNLEIEISELRLKRSS